MIEQKIEIVSKRIRVMETQVSEKEAGEKKILTGVGKEIFLEMIK